jgi:hypothetical protein
MVPRLAARDIRRPRRGGAHVRCPRHHGVVPGECCLGKSACPGKAPKPNTNPARYTPEWLFDRVTNGFSGMPTFKARFVGMGRQPVVFASSQEFSN